MKVSCLAPVALLQLPAAFVIRAVALLTHTGLVAKCLWFLACKHAVPIVA